MIIFIYLVSLMTALFDFANDTNEFTSGLFLPLIFLYNYTSHNLLADWKVCNDEEVLLKKKKS